MNGVVSHLSRQPEDHHLHGKPDACNKSKRNSRIRSQSNAGNYKITHILHSNDLASTQHPDDATASPRMSCWLLPSCATLAQSQNFYHSILFSVPNVHLYRESRLQRPRCKTQNAAQTNRNHEAHNRHQTANLHGAHPFKPKAVVSTSGHRGSYLLQVSTNGKLTPPS